MSSHPFLDMLCVSRLCRYSLHMKKHLTHLIQHATQLLVEVMINLCLCNAMPSKWMHNQTLTGGPENCQSFFLSKGHVVVYFDTHWPLFRSQMLASKDCLVSALIELVQYCLEG